MVLTIQEAREEFLLAQTKHLAHAWKVTRTDNEKFFFTDHDQKVTVNSEDYTPVGGFNASAVRNEAGLRDPSRDFQGAISSAAFTTADLRASLWHNAEVLEQIIDWRVPWAGPLKSSKYWIEEMEWDGEAWQAKVMGLTGWFQHNSGEEYGRTCMYDLGDADCKFIISAAPFVEQGLVNTVIDSRTFNAGSIVGGLGDGYYKHGKLFWVSGANAGLEGEVKEYTETGAIIELYFEPDSAIAVNDLFTVFAGCDKRRTTCINKFSNVVNFGGFPFMPSTDGVLRRTPSA